MEVSVPWLFGLMGTRSLSTEIPGIKQLTADAETRIVNGQKAVSTLEALRKDPKNEALQTEFKAVEKDLGFGLLLKRYTEDVTKATPEMIKQAAADTIPQVAPMFWSFRVMIGCGLALLLLYIVGLYFSVKKTLDTKTLYLRATLLALPLPWIACEVGWFVAEYGRQPWTIYNILPTHLSVSSLTSGDLIGSILGFVVLYTLMLIAEMWLMVRFCRKGPSSLGTGRYHFEQQ
jgi:cytochrome d ubiquinol oxidase subunit 1